MITGLGLGITASGHRAVAAAAFTGLTATDPNGSYYGLSTSITQHNSASDFLTIVFWFKDNGDQNNVEKTFARAENGGNVWFINYQGGRLRIGALNGGWVFDYLIGANNGGSYGSGTYDDGNWHQLALSFDSSNNQRLVYVDGADVTGSNFTANQEVYSRQPARFDNYTTMALFNEPTGANIPQQFLTQFWIDDTYQDFSSSNVMSKFYDSGPVDMGSDGTASGLQRPLIFHTGDTSTILTNGGTGFAYTLGSNGTGVNIDAANGPLVPVPRNNTLTINGNTQIDTSRKQFGSGSILFDGSGDYISVAPGTAGDFIFTGAFTMEGWFNYDEDTGDASAALIGNKSSSGHGSNFFLLFRNYDRKIQMLLPGWHVGVATGVISADTWHHFALVRDASNNVAFFLDGTRQQSNTSISGVVGQSPNQESIGVGGLADGQIMFNQGGNGWMDEVRVSDVARYDPTASSHTLPSAAFTNDSNTKLLLHGDGSDGSTSITDDQ